MITGRNYKKDNETSYALGASLTYELLRKKPRDAIKVYFHSAFLKSKEYDTFVRMCDTGAVAYEINDRIFNRLSDKEKCLVIGEFVKHPNPISRSANHLVLVNPGNMGNLGTIIRTALGFGVEDLAVIRPAVDIYDPKVIRASMGAFFHVQVQYFDSFDDYLKSIDARPLFTFRLNGEVRLDHTVATERYSLIFGNESSGLPVEFDSIGTGIVIMHSNDIDSLSLPIAVSLALYEFYKRK